MAYIVHASSLRKNSLSKKSSNKTTTDVVSQQYYQTNEQRISLCPGNTAGPLAVAIAAKSGIRRRVNTIPTESKDFSPLSLVVRLMTFGQLDKINYNFNLQYKSESQNVCFRKKKTFFTVEQ